MWVLFLGWENPLEEGMATHSSVLAWRNAMDRGAWQVTVHRVAKGQTHLKLTTHAHMHMLGTYMLTSVRFSSYIDLLVYGVLLFLYGLCFKVYFAWYEYCYPHFLAVSNLHEISFPFPSHFSLSVFFALKWVFCRQYIGDSFF